LLFTSNPNLLLSDITAIAKSFTHKFYSLIEIKGFGKTP